MGPFIVRLLTELEPYRDLILGLEAGDILSGAHEQWLGLDKSGRSAYIEETGSDPGDIAAPVAEEIKRKYRLVYQVVYQKAFLQALTDMERTRSALAEMWLGAEEITTDQYIEIWITKFNDRLASKLADDEQWAGAGISPTGTISWTQASQRTIASFVAYALIAPLEEWATLADEDAASAAKAWLEEAWSKTGSGRIADSIDGLYRLGSRGSDQSPHTYVRNSRSLVKSGSPKKKIS